jgi:D-hexose-6-phosphate mutarotase
VRIHGLEGVSYIDQLDPGPLKVQDGAVLVDGETDNINLDSPESCRLVDAGWLRELRVEKTGSRSTVVWNPWIDKAARMSDFGDAEYLHMVCIEAANAESDSITVAPGDTHSLGTAISASMG